MLLRSGGNGSAQIVAVGKLTKRRTRRTIILNHAIRAEEFPQLYTRRYYGGSEFKLLTGICQERIPCEKELLVADPKPAKSSSSPKTRERWCGTPPKGWIKMLDWAANADHITCVKYDDQDAHTEVSMLHGKFASFKGDWMENILRKIDKAKLSH
jgi:hypothetical protein